MELTHAQMEERYGRKLDSKIVMVPIGEELWHRLTDGRWEPYPPYPPYPESKNE